MAPSSRRRFLRSAPFAVTAFPLAAHALRAEATAMPQVAAQQPYSLFSAQAFADDKARLAAKPGNASLYDNPALPFTAVLTTEEKKAAKEFEWHEGRDHIFQILAGSTQYELGGRPEKGRNTKPGEWLAPASTGAQVVQVKAGDTLVIPRGLPHKRTTAESVTFVLISTTGSVPAV